MCDRVHVRARACVWVEATDSADVADLDQLVAPARVLSGLAGLVGSLPLLLLALPRLLPTRHAGLGAFCSSRPAGRSSLCVYIHRPTHTRTYIPLYPHTYQTEPLSKCEFTDAGAVCGVSEECSSASAGGRVCRRLCLRQPSQSVRGRSRGSGFVYIVAKAAGAAGGDGRVGGMGRPGRALQAKDMHCCVA